MKVLIINYGRKYLLKSPSDCINHDIIPLIGHCVENRVKCDSDNEFPVDCPAKEIGEKFYDDLKKHLIIENLYDENHIHSSFNDYGNDLIINSFYKTDQFYFLYKVKIDYRDPSKFEFSTESMEGDQKIKDIAAHIKSKIRLIIITIMKEIDKEANNDKSN